MMYGVRSPMVGCRTVIPAMPSSILAEHPRTFQPGHVPSADLTTEAVRGESMRGTRAPLVCGNPGHSVIQHAHTGQVPGYAKEDVLTWRIR